MSDPIDIIGLPSLLQRAVITGKECVYVASLVPAMLPDEFLTMLSEYS
jgi:hypothetical protein